MPFTTLHIILKTLQAKRYKVYTRPYELNIVGIRADSTVPNRFDDELHVFFKTKNGAWVHYPASATTDPGTYWLRNPLNTQGTAILKEGQYINSYQIGMHRGLYTALVQRLPVTVLRDYDRDAVLDFWNGTPQTGLFGINIHRASLNGTTKFIDRYSAGCQVFANVKDFNQFMQLAKDHRRFYGNQFTYTLIDKRALTRSQKRKLVVNATGLAVGAGAAFITYQLIKQ